MDSFKIGVISDTHGLLRKNVLEIFKDCKLILHAGDIGNIEIIKELKKIAPVTAVRGNCDRNYWADEFSYSEMIEMEDIIIYILHDIEDLDLDPPSSGINVVISGHSHISLVKEKEGVLFFNPGSAGPKRFDLPISIGILTIKGEKIKSEIIEL